jgi:hypothetical protein
VDSLVLETVIGLVFVFAVFSSVVSVLTETISRFLGLRGEYLLRGLRTLLDGGGKFALPWLDILKSTTRDPAPEAGEPANPMVTKLLATPLLAPFADKGTMPGNAGNATLSNPDRRSLPSYISARSFTQALIGLLVPDATGTTTMTEIIQKLNDKPDLPEKLRTALQQLATQADEDITKFRLGVEHWYDDQMDRVSGWYKRHVRWISLAIGAVLVLVFNLNAVTVARTLYTDEALRGAVVSEAADAASCGTKEPAACLADLRAQVTTLQASGLPVGWGTVPACVATAQNPVPCDWLQRRGLLDPDPEHGFWSGAWFVLVFLAGWALMVLVLLPGARFWFDALSRLGSLRASGPKPDRATAP